VDPTPEEEAARKKKTLLLLAGGAVSLILPLLGVLYLRWKDTRQAPKQHEAAVFQQREGAERRITPPSSPAMAAAVVLTQPAAVPAAPAPGQGSLPLPSSDGKASTGGGSLGFIKGSDDYYSEKKKEEAKAEPPKEGPKAAPAEEPKPAPAKSTAKAKPGKKPFVMPRLQPGKGFTCFKRPGQQQQEAPSGEDGPADMQEMLKDIPGGANNPDVQKYLKQQGGR
jgi:hypothetical protein